MRPMTFPVAKGAGWCRIIITQGRGALTFHRPFLPEFTLAWVHARPVNSSFQRRDFMELTTWARVLTK
jgi:hypothetical protein